MSFSEIKYLDLYLTSKCNLKCSYCYISKNPAYYELDKNIQEKILDGSMMRSLKEILKGKEGDLECIELWGGEPTLGLENFNTTVVEMLDTFPNLKQFKMSTNLTTDMKYLISFVELLKAYPRDIEFEIQISLDGPEYITDFNRGKGVTKAIEENIQRLVDYCNAVSLERLKIDIHMKPTLSSVNIGSMVSLSDTDDVNMKRVFHYFAYFESIYGWVLEHNKNANFTFKRIPNATIVCPGQYTSEDGKVFALFVEVMEKLDMEKPFRYYKDVNFFKKSFMKEYRDIDAIRGGIGYCGVFKSKVAVMPGKDNYVSGCHRAYPEFFESYVCGLHIDDPKDRNVLKTNDSLRKASIDNFFVKIGDKSFDNAEKKLEAMYRHPSLSITSIASMLYEASLCGQADKIYSENRVRLLQVSYLIRTMGSCLYDNINTTGTFTVMDYSKIRLYCNGAFEVMFKYYPEKCWG